MKNSLFVLCFIQVNTMNTFSTKTNAKALVSLLLAGLLTLAPSERLTADTVTFTVSADTFSTTINSLTAGGAGSTNEFTVGILFSITLFNGVSKPINTIGFCGEIAQPVSPGTTYTFDIVPMSQLDSATAGQSGSASSGIPSGGIGALAAARLNYLFDHHYSGTTTASWTRTNGTPDTLAFQIAQWEITHDTDLSLSTTTGNLWIDSTANTTTVRANTISLAQTWLTEIKNANVTTSYKAQNWDVLALTNPTNQDLVLATAKGALVPAPEPGSLLLAAIGITITFRRRRP